MTIELPKHHQPQTDENLARINAIKQAEADLLQLIADNGREAAIARTNIEQGVMWAIRDIAQPKAIQPKINNSDYSGFTAAQLAEIRDAASQNVKVNVDQYSGDGRLEISNTRTLTFRSKPLKSSGVYDLAAISDAYEIKADDEILCPFYAQYMSFLINGVAVIGELKTRVDDDTCGEFYFERHDLLVIVKGRTGSIEFISKEPQTVEVQGLVAFAR